MRYRNKSLNMPYYLFIIKSKIIGFVITREFSIPLSNMGRNETTIGSEMFVLITINIKVLLLFCSFQEKFDIIASNKDGQLKHF